MNNESNQLFDVPPATEATLAELYPNDAATRNVLRPLVHALHTLDLSPESAIKTRLHHQIVAQAQTLHQPAKGQRRAARLSMVGGVTFAWVLMALVMLVPAHWHAPAQVPAFNAAVPTVTTSYLTQTGVPTDTSLATITPTQVPIATGQMLIPAPTMLHQP